MYTILHDFTQRPAPFSRYTAGELWTRPHLAQQMLEYHLNQETELASRPRALIEKIGDWIDAQLSFNGKSVCDLGCGPGLYAEDFARRGATVTGVDLSPLSLEHARKEAARSGSGIHYLQADYLNDPLPEGFDLVSLIYYDFGILSADQRKQLLARIHDMLAPGGAFVFDVLGTGSLAERSEQTLVERNLLHGFWAPGDYVGMQQTWLYPDEAVSLDHYLIIEPEQHWEIFNWFQYFTKEHLTRELTDAGFTIDTLTGSLSGDPLHEDAPVFGVIARKEPAN